MTTPTTAVQLRLPRGWIEFDPRAADLSTEIMRAAHDEWGTEVPPELQPHLAKLLGPLVVDVRRMSSNVDAVLVGMYVRAIAMEGAELPLVLTANAVLAISPPYVALDHVRENLAAGWTAEPVDLPAGRGVKSQGPTQITDPEWDGPVSAQAFRFFLPVPGTPRLAILSFVTPNLDFVDAFADVFDAVAESLSFS